MVRRKWVDDLKDVEGTRVYGHVSQPVPMCCRRRGDTITFLVFQIEITFRSCNAALSSFADGCMHGRSCTASANGPEALCVHGVHRHVLANGSASF